MNYKLLSILIIGITSFSYSSIVHADLDLNASREKVIDHSETPLKLEYKGVNNLDELRDFQYNHVRTLYKDHEIIGGYTQKVGNEMFRNVLIKKNNYSWISIRFDITDILKKLKSQSKHNRDQIIQLEKDITIPQEAIQKGNKS